MRTKNKNMIKLNRIFCHYFFICYVMILLFWARKLRPIFRRIKTYFLIGLGIFLISWTLYNRLFRDRPAKPLPIEFSSYWQLTYVLLFITALIGVISIIYRLIRKYLNKESKEPHPLVVKLLTFLGKLLASYSKPYIAVYEDLLLSQKYIWAKRPPIVLSISQFIFKNIRDSWSHIALIVIATEILPQFIVAIALFIDVFVFHEFYYFYRALTLMLIVLVYRVFIYLITDFGRKAIKELEQYMICTPIQGIGGSNTGFMYSPKPKLFQAKMTAETYEKMKKAHLAFKYTEYLLDVLLNALKAIYAYYYYPARLVITLLYLSSWGMVVFCIFFVESLFIL